MLESVGGDSCPDDLAGTFIDAANRIGLRAFRVLDRVVVGAATSGDVAVMDRLVQATWWALTDCPDEHDASTVVAELSAEYQELTGALPADADATFDRMVTVLHALGLLGPDRP